MSQEICGIHQVFEPLQELPCQTIASSFAHCETPVQEKKSKELNATLLLMQSCKSGGEINLLMWLDRLLMLSHTKKLLDHAHINAQHVQGVALYIDTYMYDMY